MPTIEYGPETWTYTASTRGALTLCGILCVGIGALLFAAGSMQMGAKIAVLIGSVLVFAFSIALDFGSSRFVTIDKRAGVASRTNVVWGSKKVESFPLSEVMSVMLERQAPKSSEYHSAIMVLSLETTSNPTYVRGKFFAVAAYSDRDAAEIRGEELATFLGVPFLLGKLL